jgi:hypothetical protein
MMYSTTLHSGGDPPCLPPRNRIDCVGYADRIDRHAPEVLAPEFGQERRA